MESSRTLSQAASAFLSAPPFLCAPVSLLYLHVPFPGPGDLPLYLSLSPCLSSCPPVSCPLGLNSGAAPTSPHCCSGSGSGGFLPGQLMILLIFTVSTGDQPATPAALPRCPPEPVSPAGPTYAPLLPGVPGSLLNSVSKLSAIQCQISKRGVDSTSSRT